MPGISGCGSEQTVAAASAILPHCLFFQDLPYRRAASKRRFSWIYFYWIIYGEVPARRIKERERYIVEKGQELVKSRKFHGRKPELNRLDLNRAIGANFAEGVA